jgi:Spy/CpxP family protein refolding chaperone
MGRGQGAVDGQRFGRRRAMGARAALRGITLSDAQRTQLRAVADKYRTERRALADQARAQWGRRAGAGQRVEQLRGRTARRVRPSVPARRTCGSVS